MNRCRYLSAILLTLLFSMSPSGASAGGGNNPTYDGVIDFGPQLLHMDDGCLALNGTVTSGNFFEDLKRMETGSRFEFTKGGRVVTDYPELLTTSIRIIGQCAATLSNPPSSVFHGDSFSLKFGVEWKDGMQLRPAELSPDFAHCTGYSSIPIPKQAYTIPSITCQLTVESKGVPLADHLIVSVYTADGKRLTRLSARP
jgi:hypothetical protein